MKERNIFKETDHAGREVLVLSRNWPDGSRYRRRMPNMTVAKKVRARIEESIAMGTWQALKKELTEPEKKVAVVEEFDPTIAEFAEIYYTDYCKVQNTAPGFKRYALDAIIRLAGEKKLRTFSPDDVQKFKKDRLAEVGMPATVNNTVAVLSNMFTYALDVKKLITEHPVFGTKKLKVDEVVRRIMTIQQERAMVDETMRICEVVGAFLGFLGETGLRQEEGMLVKRELVDIRQEVLTIEASKNYKTRQVPLSAYAIELVRGLTPVVGDPHVFVRLDTMNRLYPDYIGDVFREAKVKAGVPWLKGCHDFRHYRATQWLKKGVDIETVKQWMGHKDIRTTMIYLHFDKDAARTMFREAEKRELKEWKNEESASGENSAESI